MNGITEAVVQREVIDQYLASNLFWINVAGSLVLALGFAAAGPLLARIYHDPLITGVPRAFRSRSFSPACQFYIWRC